ncbi:MAG: DASS family sodium-coupled anion symporter [Oceanicaulis sp.]
MTARDDSGPALYQRIGLFAGPIIALAVAFGFSPEGLPREASVVAAVGLLMAIWWATEAIPVAATAFAPIVILPLAGVASIAEAAGPYANPIIYLFLGGFVIALAIERCGLHRRIAFSIFAVIGADARFIVAGFMVAAAFVSMWISNSSTTLMLLPIAVSVVTVISETMPELDARERRNFGACLLLGLAYAATIGGLSTLVGTPPNAFLAGFMQETYGVEMGFARWMMVGLPVALCLLPMVWLMLVRVIFPVGFRASGAAMTHIHELRGNLGKMSKAEVRTTLLFLALVVSWVFREPIQALTGLTGLTDAGVAMAAAMSAFLIPSGKANRALVVWEDMSRLPWGVLILFGGGLALASAVASSGLALWIGQQLSPLGAVNIVLLIIAATAMVIFLTELTSNLGTAATFLPVIAAIAVETGQDPLVFVIPVTLAASCAFMLPVATPPNAIVFSSGLVSIPQMVRAGFWLNIISVVLLSLVALYWAPMIY